MTMFKSVMSGLALASATALLSVSAFADGPSALRPWTGFYVGVNAGWAWGDADLRSKFGCPDDFCAYVNPDNLGLVGGLGTGSFNADGFTGGVQAGYNWQQGKVVLGYEVDFNAFDLGGSQFGVGSFPAGLDPNHAAGVGTSI